MHLTKSLFVDFMDYPKLARRKANNPTIYKKIRKIETEEQEDHIMAIWQAVEDVVKTYLETEISIQQLSISCLADIKILSPLTRSQMMTMKFL
jgi:hypothetical protein